MLTFPNIKINIGLNIIGKRADGFHDIESVFYPVPFCDALEIIPADKFSFEVEGLLVTSHPEDNLCVKAYRLLEKEFKLPPVQIFLLKKIPSGAGLGGGSSDASFTLKMLNDIFELKLSIPQLENYAAILGSDCPFFIQNEPSLVTGRGTPNPLTPKSPKGDLNGIAITLVLPSVHISTKEAFANISPRQPAHSLIDSINRPVETWKDAITNDFEVYVFKKYPALKNIKEELYKAGAAYASLSGSGSAIYALSEKPLSIEENKIFRNYYFWQGATTKSDKSL